MARRPISKPSLGCILASLLGVYCIISENGAIDLSGSTFLGNLLILGAMASWIVYTFISKGLGERYSSLKLTTVQTLLSIPLFIPFTVSEVPAWQVPSQTAFLHLLFLGVSARRLHTYSFFTASIPWGLYCPRPLKSNSGDYHHYRQDCAGRRAYMASGCRGGSYRGRPYAFEPHEAKRTGTAKEWQGTIIEID